MMPRRPGKYVDPERYVKSPFEIWTQELTVVGGTVSILQGTLDRVNRAGLRNGLDHMVGGLMFKAVQLIREKIDADSAGRFAQTLYEKLDDIQLDVHPWTVRHAVPFLQGLIKRLQEGDPTPLSGL